MEILEIKQIPVLRDNYIYIIREPISNNVAVIDPAVDELVLQEAKKCNWNITHILNTHHHNDHVGGNLGIQKHTGCKIVGPLYDKNRIPGIDIEIDETQCFKLGKIECQILFLPGHTRGHIAYWFKEANALFCGDALFSVGCGRVFEGTMQEMWESLEKIKALPPETSVFCAHEYTESNVKFALSIDPENPQLKKKELEVKSLRSLNKPTVPFKIGDELQINPFLRSDSYTLKTRLNMHHSKPVEVFSKIRKLKDNF
jgi:hydroxyacylglutathione hydrolase